MSKTVF